MSLVSRIGDLATAVSGEFKSQRKSQVTLDAYKHTAFTSGSTYTIDTAALGSGSFNATAYNYDGQIVAVVWTPSSTGVFDVAGIVAANPDWTFVDMFAFSNSGEALFIFVRPASSLAAATIVLPYAGPATMSVYAVSNADRLVAGFIYGAGGNSENYGGGYITQNSSEGPVFGLDLEQGGLLVHQIMASASRTFQAHVPFGSEGALPGTVTSIGGASTASMSMAAWSTPITSDRTNQTIRPTLSASTPYVATAALVFRRAYRHRHALDERSIGGVLPISKAPTAASGEVSSSKLVRADDSRLSLPTRLQDVAATTTNWNSATSTGWYKATGATNAPDAQWWMGEVISQSSSYVVQTLYPFTNANFGNGTVANAQPMRRVMQNGVWGPWYPLLQSVVELDNRYAPTRLTSTSASAGNIAYNSMILSGWYVMDSTATNAPAAVTCYLEVRAYSTTYIEQVARNVTTGATYRRYMTAGTWGAWEADLSDVAPTLDPNVQFNGAASRVVRDRNMVSVHLEIQVMISWNTTWVLAYVPAGYLPKYRVWMTTMNASTGGVSPSLLLGTNGYISQPSTSYAQGTVVYATAAYRRA